MDSKLKYSVGVVEIIGIAVGIISLIGFGQYLKLNSISESLDFVFHIKCAIITVISALCGPVAGVLVGTISVIGNDIIYARQFQYEMMAAYAIYGYFVGKFAHRYGIREGKFNIINIANFNCIQMCANIMVFALFVPLVSILKRKVLITNVLRVELINTLYNVVINFTLVTVLFIIISSIIKIVSKNNKDGIA